MLPARNSFPCANGCCAFGLVGDQERPTPLQPEGTGDLDALPSSILDKPLRENFEVPTLEWKQCIEGIGQIDGLSVLERHQLRKHWST
jgi:hypothetical protein